MAESRDDPTLFWVDPHSRGVLPMEKFHLPKRLRRILRQGRFEVRCDSAFEETLDGCAQSSERRPDTWINKEIRDLYLALYRMGHAHSVEAWRDGQLVGGLYGVALGGAFFGESMFSRESGASKQAFVALARQLIRWDYRLIDCQMATAHLRGLGGQELAREAFLDALAGAVRAPGRLGPWRLDQGDLSPTA